MRRDAGAILVDALCGLVILALTLVVAVDLVARVPEIIGRARSTFHIDLSDRSELVDPTSSSARE